MARKSGGNNMGRKKSAPPSKSVRIHEDVYDNAMIAAAIEKKDMTQFMSDLLRPIIKKMLRDKGLKPNEPEPIEPQ